MSLDGSYGIRSAKGIFISKNPLVAVPTRRRTAEDPQGDTAVADSQYRYSPSGISEGTVVHKAEEWRSAPSGEYELLQRVAGDVDWETQFFQWKTVFPFAYHAGDFALPEDGQNSPLDRVEFITGNYRRSYVEPKSVEVDVDERYARSKFYKLASHFHLTDDGGIILSDGYGSRIILSGGKIQLESAGDILSISAARVVSMGKDVILRAESNVDLSAANGDVRAKAEKNFQVLAGNSGVGGILLESKGLGVTQDYRGKVGDEVRATGITLLSKGSNVNLVSRDVYVRSGVDQGNAEGVGTITLDAAGGRSNIIYYAQQHNFLSQGGVAFWHGVSGSSPGAPNAVHFFGSQFTSLAGQVSIDKDVIIRNGGLIVKNSITASGSIQTSSSMGCNRGFLGVGDTARSNLNSLIDQVTRSGDEGDSRNVKEGTKVASFLSSAYYEDKRIGQADLLNNQIGFSFRDTSGRSASAGTYGYDADGFKFLETRWQQLARVGATTSQLSIWNEPNVLYQGQQQQPWPGVANWSSEDNPTFLAYDSGNSASGFQLFDTSTGIGKSRDTERGSYESPELRDWLRQYTCQGNFKI